MMVTISRVVPVDVPVQRYQVFVDWGNSTEFLGEFRWRWLARLIAWMSDGVH